ncbi:MAG: hypothetical protein JWN40_1011 [Phycisphaerales bacterium]|nr:hypothetical protein [Phycisphaerales bacterium]
MPPIEPLEPRTLLTAGGLDPTFGVGGKVTTNFTVPLAAHAFALAALPDGRTVVFARSPLGDAQPLSMARFTSSGKIDPTFGQAGEVFRGYGAAGDPFDALRLPDGKLIVLVHRGEKELSVARYLADGAPDTTFGHAGTTILPLTNLLDARFAVAPDGKIVVVVAGFMETICLFRLTASGMLDTSFGNAGTATVDNKLDLFIDLHLKLAVRPDGRI